jgi:hypothetical protein
LVPPLQPLEVDSDKETAALSSAALARAEEQWKPGSSWRDRVEFLEVASYFETSEEKYLQLIDPSLGTLVYKDSDHLNRDGTNRLEQLFRAKVFGTKLCS